MQYMVLTTRPEDNLYGDTPMSYTFPMQYLRHFGPLHRGEMVMALLYEPRRGRGRQSYVGWTTLTAPPQPDPGTPGWWVVRYDDVVRPFPRPVPLTLDGHAFEARLREGPRQAYGALLQGNSVRTVTEEDFLAILAQAQVLPEGLQQSLPVLGPAETDGERAVRERLVRQLARDGSFRTRVLRAYDWRCAVSGLGYLDFERHASGQLVDGAHLRPVGLRHAGSDETRNGLALTPSLHRLFDAGLFTLEYEADQLLVLPAQTLTYYDLAPAGTGAWLPLESGQRVRLPAEQAWWPDPQALAYHRIHIFRG